MHRPYESRARRGFEMRDYLLFYVNGKEHRVSGDSAFMPLSSYLRYEQGATGTKVVCEEGDCGACSVILGRVEIVAPENNGATKSDIQYRVVNSCIQFLYQLDCTHVVTIEGLKYSGKLNPVQEAMVACHGAQCGYFTPGFVVAMCAMFDQKPCTKEQDVKDGLIGNLCRCTGYEPIIKAGMSVDADHLLKLHELYPSKEMLRAFSEHSKNAVLIGTEEHTFFNPTDLDSAVKFKGERPGTVIVAGGTDVCVYWNKRGMEPRNLMNVSHLPGLRELTLSHNELVVGARTTLSELEDFTRDTLPELHKMLWLFGSPQIRNAGTLAGNIANASPIADTLPFLHVIEAEIELFGTKGSRRVNINKFYQGYKQLDMSADEMITQIIIPLPAPEEIVKLYKVSRRQNLDISSFTAAFRLKLSAGKIERISIAYGGVAPVIVRLRKTEDFLAGKPLELDILEEAGDIAVSEISPISDVRGSSDFRNTLAANILKKLYFETKTAEVTA